jgi:hypothetical protein
MEECGQEGRGPTWAVAPTRRRRRFKFLVVIFVIHMPILVITHLFKKGNMRNFSAVSFYSTDIPIFFSTTQEQFYIHILTTLLYSIYIMK